MLLMIDNYDSFTYNLVQLFQRLDQEVTVYLNDRITPAEIAALNPAALIISPGPCTPAESGICPDAVRQLYKTVPILGICLGHQVIGQVFGGQVGGAGRIMHGKTDRIRHTGEALFKTVPEEFTAARYHSLAVSGLAQAPELIPLACSVSDGSLMALKHKDYPVYGLQFHPESFASEYGLEIAGNFLTLAAARPVPEERRSLCCNTT